MAMESAMALTNRLLVNAQALAAITAHLRSVSEGLPLDPELHRAIDGVIDGLDARAALDELTDSERELVTAFARSYLRQSLELVDEPFRSNTWSHDEPAILQAQGAASGMVARLIREAGLGRASMRILDVGTGVAGLAIAFCREFPDSTVCGLEPWTPALALARENVRQEGLEHRIALHEVTIEDFADAAGFDLVWLPSFFIPRHAMATAVARIHELLRPDGQVVVGVVESADEPLAGAVDAMITIRSGGSVLEPADAVAMLRAAGFSDVAEVTRQWRAPLRLVAGVRATAAGSETAHRPAASAS